MNIKSLVVEDRKTGKLIANIFTEGSSNPKDIKGIISDDVLVYVNGEKMFDNSIAVNISEQSADEVCERLKKKLQVEMNKDE